MYILLPLGPVRISLLKKNDELCFNSQKKYTSNRNEVWKCEKKSLAGSFVNRHDPPNRDFTLWKWHPVYRRKQGWFCFCYFINISKILQMSWKSRLKVIFRLRIEWWYSQEPIFTSQASDRKKSLILGFSLRDSVYLPLFTVWFEVRLIAIYPLILRAILWLLIIQAYKMIGYGV